MTEHKTNPIAVAILTLFLLIVPLVIFAQDSPEDQISRSIQEMDALWLTPGIVWACPKTDREASTILTAWSIDRGIDGSNLESWYDSNDPQETLHGRHINTWLCSTDFDQYDTWCMLAEVGENGNKELITEGTIYNHIGSTFVYLKDVGLFPFWLDPDNYEGRPGDICPRTFSPMLIDAYPYPSDNDDVIYKPTRPPVLFIPGDGTGD